MASRYDQFVENQRKRAEGVKRKALDGSPTQESKQATTLTSRSDAFRNGYLKSFDNINELGGIKGGNYGPVSTPEIVANSKALAQQRASKPKTQYQKTQEEISKMPPGVKQFASVMNWITAGNPVGNFLSQATNIPGVSVTTPDSTGSKVADTIGRGAGKFVAPALVPSGAPLGSGTLAAPYSATEKILATGKGQKAVEGLSKVIPKVKPETAQKIARGALTEGIAGAVQAPAQTLVIDSGASGKDLALNAALGAGGGFILGGAGGSLSGLFKKNGIPDSEVSEILALPESSKQTRMNAAAARSQNAYGADPIANPFTFELPEGSPGTAARTANIRQGRTELQQIDSALNELNNKYEQRVIDEYKYLKSSRDNRSGVEQGSLQRDTTGEVVGRAGRISNNPLWYQEFHSQNGRVPTNKDLYQLARERVDNGFQDESGLAPSWRQETGYDEQLAAYTAARDNLRASVREMDPAVNLTDQPIREQRLKDLRREGSAPKPRNQAPIQEPAAQVTAEPISDPYNIDNADIPQFLRRRPSATNEVAAAAPEPVTFDPNAEPILRPHQFDDASGLGISAFGKTKPYDSLSNDTRSQLVTRQEREPKSIKGIGSRLYTALVDDLQPFNEQDKILESIMETPLSAGERTHTLGLSTRGADVVSKQIITDALVDSEGNVVGESLKDILRGLPKKNKHIYVDFEDYLLNKHAITRMVDRGEKVFRDELNWTPEYGAQKVAEYEARFPEFKETSDRLYEFNRQLVNSWMVDTGIISPEQAAAWFEANPYYVPNKRQFTSLEKKSGGRSKSKKGFGNQSVPVKEYGKGGSQRKIISPIEAMIENVDAFIKTAKRNQVMQQYVKNIEKDPEAFAGWAEIVQNQEGQENILSQLLGADGMDNLLGKMEGDFIKKTQLDHDNIVRVLIDGDPVHVKINDPHLLNAITALGPEQGSAVINAVGKLTNTMKVLTTGNNPVFNLTRNIFRDIPQAYIASKTTDNPVSFMADLLSAGFEVAFRRGAYKDYLNVGGGHSSSVASNRNLLKQSKTAVLPGKKGLKVVPKLYQGYENIMNMAEMAPRLAEFKRTAQATGDIKKALFEAQDVTTNFKRRGTLTKELDKFFPYFNAAIQGMDQIARVYKNNPAKALVKSILALSVPTMALYAMNYNDPNYQKLSNRVKDAFFLIPKGDGTFIKIAKPQEQGTVFADLPERIMRLFQQQDPAAFRDFADRIRTTMVPPGIQGLINGGDIISGITNDTVFGPAVQTIANKSWNGSPIVPGYLERLSPGLQSDAKTTTPAAWVGEKIGYSPKKLDYLAKQYTGVLGQLGQPLLTPGGSVGSALTQQVTADPVFSNDLSTEFYKYKDKLDQAYTDRDSRALPKWYNDSLRKKLGKLSTSMSAARKEIRTVQSDKNMDNAAKREKLRLLQDKINTLAEQGNQLARDKVPYK